MPGASTPGSVQLPSTPGSVSTGFAGYANTLVPPGPHVQSTTSQSTDSVDGGNVQTASSEGSASTGNKKSGGIFGKFFRKEPKQGGTKSNEDLPFRGQNLYGRSQEVAIDPNQYDPLVEMGNLPTPDFIRPLPGQRLIPRREPNALSRVAANPLPTTQIGRARAMAAARLNEAVSEASESDWQTTINSDGDRSTMNFSLSFDQSVRELVRVTDSQEQHRLIVLASAPVADEASIAAWSNYVQLYSDGSFNISHPPAPPMRRTDFAFLPAMYPHDEHSRIQKHHSIDGGWDSELGGKLIALMRAAGARFKLNQASLSVFDEKSEKLRVDCGYYIKNNNSIDRNIDRTTSIAAHALYSEEVLVIMDTHQDWRFARNPLVTGSPQIRFFVGAPLISNAGEIIAVFALFGKQPRSEFSRLDRREMADYAALMAKDICLWAEHMADPDLRGTTGESRRDTRTNLIPNPLHIQRQRSPPNSQQTYFPTGIEYNQRPVSLESEYSYEDILENNLDSSESEYHESSISDSDVLYMAPPQHQRLYTGEPELSNDNTPENFRQFLRSGLDQSEHRPFSDSDLTSIDMPRDNTPNDSFYSDQEDMDGPATPRQPQFVFPNNIYRHIGPSGSALSLDNSFGRDYMDSESIAGSTLEPERTSSGTLLTRPISVMSISSVGTALSSRIGDPNFDDEYLPPIAPMSKFAEQQLSCQFSAERLSADQVYAVQVDCPYSDMSDQELLGPNGVTLKILVSHGMPKNFENEINKKVHWKKAFLQALRTEGAYHTWSADDTPALREDGAVSFGVFVPLSPDKYLPRPRDHGIVYAVFARAKFDSNGRLQQSSIDQIALDQAAKSMTILIFDLKPDHFEDPSTRSATRSGPARGSTPTIIGATEMGDVYYSRRSAPSD